MDLPSGRIEAPPDPYREFCEREAGACDREGESVIAWTTEIHRELSLVNREVNSETKFVPDPENSGLEEIWGFPENGRGDCEDFVLEKRQRLIDAGFPSAALGCAIAFHAVQLFPHAVLLVETTQGTWVLDNLHDEVLCWDAVPYEFKRRELPDGQWMRFEQQ